jgi:4-hydroxyphenylacetate 3-hydroxylase, reductase component
MAFNNIEFRNALGNFATGVTVITARDLGDKGYVGITANSFNSVSMDPPLVLWSIGKSARSLPAYEKAGYFAINVLAADQVDISNRFATRQADKFNAIDFRTGVEGLPILNGCAAVFQCQTNMMYEGGDHIIFVGEVLEFESVDKPGLVFSKGKYALSQPHPALKDHIESREQSGFVAAYTHYLLLMAAQAFENSFLPILSQAGINSHYEWRVLALLNDRNGQTADELAEHTPAKYAFISEVLKGMISGGLVEMHKRASVDYFDLTTNGRRKVCELQAAALVHERDALENISLTDMQLKTSLMDLISAL